MNTNILMAYLINFRYWFSTF